MQVFLEECQCIIIEEKVNRYVNDDLESSSDLTYEKASDKSNK